MTGIDYTTLQEMGIVFAMFSGVGVAIVAGVKRIYCKGKSDTLINERITLLEQWKDSHIKEYQKLLDKNEEAKEVLSDVGKKISYLTGLFDGNGNKE